MLHELFFNTTEDPILLLPIGLRLAALNLWFAHKHLSGLETPAGITFPVSNWMKGKLTEKLALDALEYALTTHAMQMHKTTADVLCSMAAFIEEARQRMSYDKVY